MWCYGNVIRLTDKHLLADELRHAHKHRQTYSIHTVSLNAYNALSMLAHRKIMPKLNLNIGNGLFGLNELNSWYVAQILAHKLFVKIMA